MLRGIYLLRHAKSMSNMGFPSIVNSPLSPIGKQQAKGLNYQVDLVISSPMRRAIDTLAHSNIKYHKLLIVNQARELICEPGDCFKWEICQLEDPIVFNRTMRSLANQLYLLHRKHLSMIVITHGCVITGLLDKQIGNGEIEQMSIDRLKDVINGVELPTNYHQMTGW